MKLVITRKAITVGAHRDYKINLCVVMQLSQSYSLIKKLARVTVSSLGCGIMGHVPRVPQNFSKNGLVIPSYPGVLRTTHVTYVLLNVPQRAARLRRHPH